MIATRAIALISLYTACGGSIDPAQSIEFSFLACVLILPSFTRSPFTCGRRIFVRQNTHIYTLRHMLYLYVYIRFFDVYIVVSRAIVSQPMPKQFTHELCDEFATVCAAARSIDSIATSSFFFPRCKFDSGRPSRRDFVFAKYSNRFSRYP